MEDISDSDEHSDTIMLVEEDTVLEVLSEIEENTSENSYEDRQLPTMITHGKMTIRTARNENENINEKLKLFKSLEHPLIRNQRLERRKTYKNLKITKDKQDEYDKIMRNASDFISGIFPNASNLIDNTYDSFENKYMKTDEMISENDNIIFPHQIDDINLNEEFTFGTFRNSDTKIAEHRSTLQKGLISKSKTVDFNLNLQTSSEKEMKSFSRTKHENLFTIEEADILQSHCGLNLNEKWDKTMSEGDNENMDKSVKDHQKETVCMDSKERPSKISKVQNDVNTILHNNPAQASKTCSGLMPENLEANAVRKVNDSCQPNIGKDKESIQTCYIEKSIMYDYEEDRKTIEDREFKNANIWDRVCYEQIIQTQTEECCLKIKYDGSVLKTGNDSISTHYEIAFDDNINVDKDTCIETEYENERQLMEKYDSIVDLNIIEGEQARIFSDNEEMDVERKLIVDCIEAEYLDTLEKIHETDEIVVDQIFSETSVCTYHDQDQPKNVHIDIEQPINLKQHKQISIQSKCLDRKNDYEYETHINDIIERNYKEIEEKIIDTEYTMLSESFEQATSININNVNKVNKSLILQPEYYNPDADKSISTSSDTNMFPTSMYVHMVANYHTREHFTNCVDVRTNQQGKGLLSMVSHSGRDAEKRERYSEVSHRTNCLIDELLNANDEKEEESEGNSLTIEELIICEETTNNLESQASASFSGDDTVSIKIQVDVTKLVNVPLKNLSCDNDHQQKQKDLEVLFETSTDNQEVASQEDWVTLHHESISEKDSLMNLPTNHTDEIERRKPEVDPRTNICIKNQLNTRHKEDPLEQTVSNKDDWSSNPVKIQADGFQQDTFQNIPISIERNKIQRKEDAMINIPIIDQREQNNRSLNETRILKDEITKIPITIQPSKMQTNECSDQRNIFRNIPITIQTDYIAIERDMSDNNDWINIPIQQETKKREEDETDINDMRDILITLKSDELLSKDSSRDGCTNVPTNAQSVDNQIDGFRNIPIIIEGDTIIREKQESESSHLNKINIEVTDTEDIPMERNARQETIIDMKEAANTQTTIQQAMIQMDKTVEILEVNREILDMKERRKIITEMKDIKSVLSALNQTAYYETNLEDKPGLWNQNVKKDTVHILRPEHETTLLHVNEPRRVLEGEREIPDENKITIKLHEIYSENNIHRVTVIMDQIEDEYNIGMTDSIKIKELFSLPKSKMENKTCKHEDKIEPGDAMDEEEANTKDIEQYIPLIDKPQQLPNIETETMDPKKTNVTYDKNVTSDMHQVKPEKYINKELPKNKEKERKETTDMKDKNNVSPAIPPKKLLTDKTQELPDDKSGVSRQSLISKIEENIQTINLYERRIKAIGQTIIEHESSCQGNIENEKMRTQDLKISKTKQTDESQERGGQEKATQASILFSLLLLLSLVLVFLTLFSSMPLSCSEDVDNIGSASSAPASCSLDGYLQLDTGALI